MELIGDFVNAYTVAAGLIAVLWLRSWSKHSFWRDHNMKYFTPVTFFGSMLKYVLRVECLHEVYERMYRAMGDDRYRAFYDHTFPVLLIKDPQLINAILIKDFHHFQNAARSFILDLNKEKNHLSEHIAVLRGGRWKELRQEVTHVFSSAKMKQMFEQMVSYLDLFNEHVDKQMDADGVVELEMRGLYEKVSLDIAGSCFFGINFQALDSNDELCRHSRTIFAASWRRTLYKILKATCPGLLMTLNWHEVGRETIEFMEELALNAIRMRRRSGVSRDDYLQLLIDMQNTHVNPEFTVEGKEKAKETRITFDEIDIVANVFIFTLAGYETLSAVLGYCVYELALNKNIQQKLRSEVELGKNEFGKLSYDALQNMTYMNAVIAETQRMYSNIPILTRECNEEYEIPNSKDLIPKGVSVQIPIWSLHHDSRYFPNPSVFDPERFVGENKYKIPSGVYLPFGDGPRSCLAKRFAILEVKAILSNTLLNYDINSCAKTQIPLKFQKGCTFTKTERGIHLKLIRRNK